MNLVSYIGFACPGTVKTYTDEHPLPLDINVRDGELVRERHGGLSTAIFVL